MDAAPNKFHHKIINLASALSLRLFKQPAPSFFEPCQDLEPVWITGLYRSGTTILSRLLQDAGADFGPAPHLLKGLGSRRNLNPSGFWENYLFMEWSTFLFRQLGIWGDLPFAISDSAIAPTDISFTEFINHAIRFMHDDRISNKCKIALFRDYYAGNIDCYLRREWNNQPFVKNPHFCLMQPYLDNWFPKGHYVVIFKHPTHAIASATKISPRVNQALYGYYYGRFINHQRVTLISFEDLLRNPVTTIAQLAQKFGLSQSSNVMDLLDETEPLERPAVGNDLYYSLYAQALNT